LQGYLIGLGPPEFCAKVRYEINFNRHFYRYTSPRPLEEIDAELKQAEAEIVRLLREVTE
jgi:type I restriction enzyme M protein